jgi:DNA-(apurinic or apyrimidinic site) lyase
MAAERQLRRVTDVFRRLGLEAILNLEKKDPQYVAVCNVVKRHGEEVGATLAMLNALISYRLAGRGEEHWQYFGRYFSHRKIVDVCKDFLTYLKTSPYLRIGVETRKKRILKICRYRPNLENLINTLKEISELLNVDPSQKTVVFSVKILNYA